MTIKKASIMYIEEVPNWIDPKTKLTGDKFKKVFIFSVILCPVPTKSARAVSLPESIKIPIKNYKVVSSASEMEKFLNDFNLMTFPPTGDFEERAIFVRAHDNNVLGFIDHIRNSIAHGRFNIIHTGKNDILIMEDRNKYQECSARIVVSLNTLSNWINEMGFLK